MHSTVQRMHKNDQIDVNSGKTAGPGGGKMEGRQRRTTSHSRRHHLRRPNLMLQAAAQAAADAAAARSPAAAAAAARPDSAAMHDVATATADAVAGIEFAQQAAAEIPGLAAGNPIAQGLDLSCAQPHVRPTSRAMRRCPGRLQAAALASCAAVLDTDPNHGSDDDTGRVQLRMLETHRWHVKRMEMRQRCCPATSSLEIILQHLSIALLPTVRF